MAKQRKTELYIGTFKDEVVNAVVTSGSKLQSTGYLIDELHYKFDIRRSTEFYKDSATFTIYNANNETAQEIMNGGAAVIFKAGYEDEGLANIFVGQVAYAYPEDDGSGDTALVVICNSQRGAQYQLQRTFITAFMEEGSSYYDVLKAIADYVGVPLTGANVLKDRKLDAGYIINGNVRDAVTNFVAAKLRSIGGKVIISNNEMVYLQQNGVAEYEVAYLNYNSGLKSATPIRDERYQSSEDAFNENMKYYLGLSSQGDKEVAKEKLAQAQIKPRNEIEFECLIHPGIQIGSPIFIDARRSDSDHFSVVGKFYTTELNYRGDNYGGSFNLSGKAVEK